MRKAPSAPKRGELHPGSIGTELSPGCFSRFQAALCRNLQFNVSSVSLVTWRRLSAAATLVAGLIGRGRRWCGMRFALTMLGEIESALRGHRHSMPESSAVRGEL